MRVVHVMNVFVPLHTFASWLPSFWKSIYHNSFTMADFHAHIEAHDSAFRLYPLSPEELRRPFQRPETFATNTRTESPDISQKGDQEPASASKKISTRVSSYSRQMERHLRGQMEANVITDYQRVLHIHTRKQLARQHSRSRARSGSARMASLETMAVSPLYVDFNRLSLRRGSASPRKSALPDKKADGFSWEGCAIRNPEKPDPSGLAAQRRCHELMSGADTSER